MTAAVIARLEEISAHFDVVYKKACESSQPQDWLDAALLGQQMRNAMKNALPALLAAARDGQRYRWLIAHQHDVPMTSGHACISIADDFGGIVGLRHPRSFEADAAIDAAMKESK